MDLADALVKQLDDLLADYANRASDPDRDLAAVRFISRARAAVNRVTGPTSPYMAQLETVLKQNASESWKASTVCGVIQALRADLQAGYLDTVSALIHGAVFADFLEMAEHLLDEGYKDAAAVIAGSALEAHIRSLCEVSGLAVEIGGRPKKSDSLNSELASASAYSKLDQKSITSWLDLRNKAAHGHYDDYSREQVALMIAGVRDFIVRNPA